MSMLGLKRRIHRIVSEEIEEIRRQHIDQIQGLALELGRKQLLIEELTRRIEELKRGPGNHERNNLT